MSTSNDYDGALSPLPKPQYPKFPANYENELPQGVTKENVHEHCVCWGCASRLWEKLAESTIPTSVHSETTTERPVMMFFISYWDSLDRNTLSPRQEQALQDLNEVIQELDSMFIDDRWKLPEITRLCKPFDTIFFQDCLEGTCDYAWTTHKDQDTKMNLFGLNSWGGHGGVDQIRVVPLGHPKADHTISMDAATEDRVEHLIGTVIHEQIHQLLSYYCCDGTGDVEDQGSLCSYLFARVINLFDTVQYGGKEVYIDTFSGHGPVFQVLSRQLGEVVTKVLNLRKPLDLGYIVTECKCNTSPPSECLSHCCVSYQDMQNYCKLELDEPKN
ncbi:hypothetical protein P171DRAFT_481077 [Karstenula rhodostoma CBS 690.94]|uniref:Uncharacterized protein n=1 Tax=Karstenula rhodostoma CBS 690.94 TaxID=1392251 RepID=A0A9P4PVE4_9PLEO|nr:hypothetical protein P171DRAFT_481077 [Karstenula rhodostoma CBS 690.94]